MSHRTITKLLLVTVLGCGDRTRQCEDERAALVDRYEQLVRERDERWAENQLRALSTSLTARSRSVMTEAEKQSFAAELQSTLTFNGDGVAAIEVASSNPPGSKFVPVLATWVGPSGPEHATGDTAVVPDAVRGGLKDRSRVVTSSGADGNFELRVTLLLRDAELTATLEGARRGTQR